jgi:predicted DNA-binding protein YlxM (UPF0122 family)
MVKDKKAQEMYEYYKKGYSLSEVGKMFEITRQSVYCMFKCRNYILRKKKKLPFMTFQGKKYTLRNNGYYAKTDGDRNLMHRDVWEYYNGKISPNMDIHHIDHDKTNNCITNLELYTKSEHAKKFATGRNQYTK